MTEAEIKKLVTKTVEETLDRKLKELFAIIDDTAVETTATNIALKRFMFAVGMAVKCNEPFEMILEKDIGQGSPWVEQELIEFAFWAGVDKKKIAAWKKHVRARLKAPDAQ